MMRLTIKKESTMQKNVILGIIALIAVFSLNPIYFVQSGTRVVIKRFGVVSQNVVSEGMHLKIPFMDSINVVTIRPINIAENTKAYTKDNQPIEIDYNVIFTYPINDITNTVIQYQGYPYESFAKVKIVDAVKAVAGKYTASEFVTKRESITSDIETLAKDSVINDQTGKPAIILMDTPITNVDFDDQYENAIKAKQVAQQDAQKAEYRLQQAKVDKQAQIAKAEGEAQALTIKAQAINKNPAVVRLNEIEKWDGHYPLNAKVIGGGATIVDTK